MFSLKLKPISLAVMTVLAATSAAYAADAIKAEKVEVISTTPLAGFGLSEDKIPANIQVVNGEKMKEQSSLTIADFMNSNMQGVNVVETQGNPFQPDVTFHGFNANALLGSPQGLAVYQDGVRINEPFGDVVSWDLVPMNAIKQMQVIPGTNPLYGLNALGGAVSLQTKRGRDVKGGAIELSGGSWGRKNTKFEYGNVLENGVDYFIAGNYFDEDGWRDASPTTVKQMFGQLGWQDEKTDLSLTVSLADNSMTGNGLTPPEMLNSLGRSSIYTKPDQTDNKMAFINLTGSRWLNDQSLLSGNAYYRHVTTDTHNGDTNNATEQGALFDTNTTGVSPRNPDSLTPQQLFAAACQAGSNAKIIFSGKGTSVPAAGTTPTANAATDTNGNYLYAVGNLTPEFACNAILNTTKTKKNGAGGSVQLAYNQPLAGHNNQLTVGMAYDYSKIKFDQSSQYGVFTADRGVTPVPYYSDEVTSLDGTTNTWSLFATNTFSINNKLHLTASGRYNNVNVDNFDNLIAAGDIKSLTATHTFQRFNPAVGLTFQPAEKVITYASYNEGSRAPTSMELGCANDAAPCKLPNSMAGDPPLKQVVTRSVDVGAKGTFNNGIHWSLAGYHAQNDDDIQFVHASTSSSAKGYFTNIGATSRQGIDAALSGRINKLSWMASYSYINARYESPWQAFGGATLEKSKVASGDLIPGIPANQIKLRGEYQFTPQFNVGLNVLAFSSQILQGNENNGYYQNPSSSLGYYGNGRAPGYSIVNLDAKYKFDNTGWEVFAKVNNILDKDYVTGGLQASSQFSRTTNAYFGDDYRTPLFAPGAPRAAWIGVRYEFGGAKKSELDKD